MTTHMSVRPDGCAVITLDNPPVNTLAATLVASMNENVEKCKSIVFCFEPMPSSFVIVNI